MLYVELQRLAVQPRAESETTQSPTRTVILAVHPSESYYQFVARLLRMKKKRILLALELLHPYAYEPGPLGE